MLASCSGPKIITSSTGRDEQIKFIYSQGTDQGIVKCIVADDGELKKCRPMNVKFKK